MRADRDRLIGDAALGGAAFGAALARSIDAAVEEIARDIDLNGTFAVVALGSYARAELCPGSDVDVMLLHDDTASSDEVAAGAEQLWYPLWDAGLVLGHAVRTPKEALALAAEELEALTSLLEIRHLVGDPELARDVAARTRRLAHKRRGPFAEELAVAASARAEQPGPIAEMLEPNLKDGAGGLRDVQSLDWAGWAVEPDEGGVDALVRAGYLQAEDPLVLARARARLLHVRVALHRVTGGRSDQLTLQEQDAVAEVAGDVDADALVRGLSEATRGVMWISQEVWRRLRSTRRGPFGRSGGRERRLADGVVLRDGVVTLTPDATISVETMLDAAIGAADRNVPIDRASLERLRGLVAEPIPGPSVRDAFVELLRRGRAAVPVIESLDQVEAVSAVFPEWTAVRALPQRNAYHRFTVDRHLLECVAECATLIEAEGFDGDVARRARADLLLLGALLHDIAKGSPDDHSKVGAITARTVARRLGLDEHGVEVLEWLVRNHLLLADTATRRDLSDEATIVRFGRAVGDTERLDLLYALTVGDSRATGPAAWNRAKAASVRQLFVEADALLERGVVGAGHAHERERTLEHHRDLLAGGALAFSWADRSDGLLECAVVAPDRQGLLATVAGVLALHGFDVRGASLYGAPDGMALEVYWGVDEFGRLDPAGRAAVERDVEAALDGRLSLKERLGERFARYRRAAGAHDSSVQISFDLEASTTATVVEVHAPDDVGLLARVAAVFADLELDVSAALVSTLGERVVDVFYVRDVHGAKPTAPLALERLRATLMARLVRDTVVAPPQ
ncbi:MAG TPA: ACT domain-containing protein [Acidimicrobiia bacterium]|nr:ACT domain-containing protein [Acidimicrobiia bacterium]